MVLCTCFGAPKGIIISRKIREHLVDRWQSRQNATPQYCSPFFPLATLNLNTTGFAKHLLSSVDGHPTASVLKSDVDEKSILSNPSQQYHLGEKYAKSSERTGVEKKSNNFARRNSKKKK